MSGEVSRQVSGLTVSDKAAERSSKRRSFEETVLLPFFPEVLAGDTESLSGLLNVAAALGKYLADVLAFGALEGKAAGGGGIGWVKPGSG